MRKIIFAIFSLAFLTLLNVSDTCACRCYKAIYAEPLESVVKDTYKTSKVVFVGEVAEIIKKPDSFSVEVKFRVVQKWHKEIKKNILVGTGSVGGGCGYPFEIGKNYLVYASKSDGELWTDICSETDLAENSKELAALNSNKVKKRKIKLSPK